jgi:trimethylamine--corrinoid protein Co-methyltransferase
MITHCASLLTGEQAGFAGVTNAKMVDAQAGFEMATSAIAATLGGVDLVFMGSLLDALMAFDFGAAVIGDEKAQMANHLARGMDFSEGKLGPDVIAEVGPGGTFIDTRHTLERTRTTAFLPRIAGRQPRSQRQAQGALHSQPRAMQRVCDILTSENPAIFAPEADDWIRKEFQGLVAGDAATHWSGS